MQGYSVARAVVFSVMTLTLLSACGNSQRPNHSQYGGLWDQVFSQAMVENPGKAAE